MNFSPSSEKDNMATTGKNEPCPCGSGKIYVDCCKLSDIASAGRAVGEAFGDLVIEPLEGGRIDALAEARASADKAVRKHNAAPLEAFSGLSPDQMDQLLRHPFDAPGPVEYHLGLTRFPDAPFLRLFSYLMQGAATSALAATAKGNLPQKFVQAAAPWFFGEEEYARRRRYMTFRTETDFFELHTVRLIAESAGYVKKSNGQFRLTKKGEQAARAGMDGATFFDLFQAATRRYNWAYGDRYPDLPIIQHAVLFSLYLLSKEGSAFRPASFYGRLFLKAFPAALQETQDIVIETREEAFSRCYTLRTFLRFGHFFGFAELDNEQKAYGVDKRSVRKTAFLDDWLRFTLS